MIIGYTVPKVWHVTDVIVIFYFELCFSLLPPYQPKNWKFQKMKKTPGDIIILHKCTKNHDHMLYCSWHMVRDRCNCYFSFWAIFCPFTPIAAQKMKIFKKWKKYLVISSFYTCVPKIMIRWCTVIEIWCARDRRTEERTEKVTHRGGCLTYKFCLSHSISQKPSYDCRLRTLV